MITRSGEILTPHEQRPEMLVLRPDGGVVRSWPMAVEQPHGLTLVSEGGTDYVWVADSASTRVRNPDGSYGTSRPHEPLVGTVVKYRIDGAEVLRLPVPKLEAYASGDFRPTQVAVDEVRFGGSGDIWLADGYGQNLVHRYSADGVYQATLSGEEGAGRFNQPHGIYIDRRGAQPELLIADRKSKRVQVYDLDSVFLRSFGSDYLMSPSGFAAWGAEHLVIAELDGRLTVVGPEGEFIRHLGKNHDETRSRAEWPNASQDGVVVRPPLHDGEFNSPHGIAVDDNLDIYVTEFLVGGRLVRLRHLGAADTRAAD